MRDKKVGLRRLGGPESLCEKSREQLELEKEIDRDVDHNRGLSH